MNFVKKWICQWKNYGKTLIDEWLNQFSECINLQICNVQPIYRYLYSPKYVWVKTLLFNKTIMNFNSIHYFNQKKFMHSAHILIREK